MDLAEWIIDGMHKFFPKLAWAHSYDMATHFTTAMSSLVTHTRRKDDPPLACYLGAAQIKKKLPQP